MKPAKLVSLSVNALKDHLSQKGVSVLNEGVDVTVYGNGSSFGFVLHLPGDAVEPGDERVRIPFDYAISAPGKVAALICTRLRMNKRVFARKCVVEPISKRSAAQFLDQFHLMNSTSAAWNLSLKYNKRLIAVASFGKGRKMRRLAGDERSYELIRFCCAEGFTVTGGLSRLVKTFCRQRNAAEIMTYIDRQLSHGDPFIEAGFRIHDFSAPIAFWVNGITFQRIPVGEVPARNEECYTISNSGNIRMLFSCQ